MRVCCLGGGGRVGIAHFNLATPPSVTVYSVRIAVSFENEVHIKLFKEGCKAAPLRTFG